MKITHYKTIEREEGEDLELAVNNAIAQGWQPIGGVSVCQQSCGYLVSTQAMVKYEQPATV